MVYTVEVKMEKNEVPFQTNNLSLPEHPRCQG